MIDFISLAIGAIAALALCAAFPSVPDKIRSGLEKLKKLAKGGGSGEGGGP